MDLVFRESSSVRSVSAQDPESVALAGNGYRDPADHTVLCQKRRPFETSFRGEIIDYHRLAGSQRKTGLGAGIGRDYRFSDGAVAPSHASE